MHTFIWYLKNSVNFELSLPRGTSYRKSVNLSFLVVKELNIFLYTLFVPRVQYAVSGFILYVPVQFLVGTKIAAAAARFATNELHTSLIKYLLITYLFTWCVVLRWPDRFSWRASVPGMCTAHGIRSRSCLASRRQATWTLCVACILPLYGTGTVLTILRHHILHNVHIKPVKTTSFPKLSLPWDTSTIITAFSYIILAAKIIIINNCVLKEKI